MESINNLKVLSNQAMVGATQGWVTASDTRDALAAIPEVSGYLDKMQAAHQGLLDFQVTGASKSTSDTLKALGDEAFALDDRHDFLARGIDAVLTGNALIANGQPADSAVTAEAVEEIRAKLFPSGMALINRTYLEEAGEVEMAKSRLTDADRTLLTQLPIAGGTLLDAVNSWIAAGEALGTVERKRARIAEDDNTAEIVSRSDVVAARNRWIRVVRAILAGLELTEELDEESLRLILQPLQNAVTKAVEKANTTTETTEIVEETALAL